MKIETLKIQLLLFLLVVIPQLLFAQPVPPGTSAPLDGGILIALLAGLGIGIKKVHAKYRNKQ